MFPESQTRRRAVVALPLQKVGPVQISVGVKVACNGKIVAQTLGNVDEGLALHGRQNACVDKSVDLVDV